MLINLNQNQATLEYVYNDLQFILFFCFLDYKMAPQTGSAVDGYPTVVEIDGMKILQVEVHLENTRSGDVIVRPVDKNLMVLNRNEDVLRNIALPESVDPFTVEASIADGVLRVQAPLMC